MCLRDERGDGEVGDPLCIFPPIVLGDSSYSNGALYYTMICPIVGISCGS